MVLNGGKSHTWLEINNCGSEVLRGGPAILHDHGYSVLWFYELSAAGFALKLTQSQIYKEA